MLNKRQLSALIDNQINSLSRYFEDLGEYRPLLEAEYDGVKDYLTAVQFEIELLLALLNQIENKTKEQNQ